MQIILFSIFFSSGGVPNDGISLIGTPVPIDRTTDTPSEPGFNMPDLGGFPGPDTGSGYGSENEIAVLDPSYFEPTKDKMPTNINVLPVVPKGELDENPGATYEV